MNILNAFTYKRYGKSFNNAFKVYGESKKIAKLASGNNFSNLKAKNSKHISITHIHNYRLLCKLSDLIICLSIMVCVLVLCSCTSLRAGIYLLTIDKINGEKILQNESSVKNFLQEIINTSEYYTFKIYKRKAINFQFKKTRLLVHSFYAITNNDGEYHTLSFYGTDFDFYSKGAWILDSDADIASYISYLEGKNDWTVEEIKTDNRINVPETAEKIITKIESSITFYYKDHIRDKTNMDNCNTALKETFVEQN